MGVVYFVLTAGATVSFRGGFPPGLLCRQQWKGAVSLCHYR